MSEQNENETRIALLVVFALVGVLLVSVLSFGAYRALSGASDAQPASLTGENAAVVEAVEVVEIPEDEARVVVEGDVVKFYFATGKTDLARGADEVLLELALAAQSGKRLVVSGYTDASGSAHLNQELAKQRAFAVRDALFSLSVPQSALELREPQSITGSGSTAQARRVEVQVVE